MLSRRLDPDKTLVYPREGNNGFTTLAALGRRLNNPTKTLVYRETTALRARSTPNNPENAVCSVPEKVTTALRPSLRSVDALIT